jgi:quercetin dioxygenase-like cupin family protein
MGLYHLYTGDDGQSHIDDLDLKSNEELRSPVVTKSIMFSTWPPGHFIDWHPAPRRQYVIILSGQLEIGLGDGTARRFGPGDARLVEDTSGQGHTTRVVSDEPTIIAVIPLAD